MRLIPSSVRLSFLPSLGWAGLLSFLLATSLSRPFLTADSLLPSIMSLQNVTLFYWGQDRLANVLPLAASWIRDPATNLAATLWLATLCFLGVLWGFARMAARVAHAEDRQALSLQTFVLLSAACLLVFTPRAIFEMAIAHVEFSLPAVALMAAMSVSVLRSDAGWIALAGCSVACFVAVWVNPGALLPGLFVAVAASLHRRRVGLAEAWLAGSCAAAFLAWSAVAGGIADPRYAGFDGAAMVAGVGKVAVGLAKAIRPLPLAATLACLCGLAWLEQRREPGAESTGGKALVRYLYRAALLFSLAWLLLFAGNPWVQSNGHSWRYFIFLPFAAMFCLALSLARRLRAMGAGKARAVSLVAALASVAFAFSPPAAFGGYQVLREAEGRLKPGSHLFAGDYWQVWPAVLADLVAGHEAHGLASRGEANAEAARGLAGREIDRRGHASVLCLRAPLSECMRQVQALLGSFPLVEAVPFREGAIELRLAPAASLERRGEAFQSLPSQVGARGAGGVQADGRAGFLVFGPYAALEAGHYRLTVFGRVDVADGAFADLVSADGSVLHGRFPLREGNGEPFLLEVPVELASRAERAEVRVWVEAGSQLQLSGYRLARR